MATPSQEAALREITWIPSWTYGAERERAAVQRHIDALREERFPDAAVRVERDGEEVRWLTAASELADAFREEREVLDQAEAAAAVHEPQRFHAWLASLPSAARAVVLRRSAPGPSGAPDEQLQSVLRRRHLDGEPPRSSSAPASFLEHRRGVQMDLLWGAREAQRHAVRHGSSHRFQAGVQTGKRVALLDVRDRLRRTADPDALEALRPGLVDAWVSASRVSKSTGRSLGEEEHARAIGREQGYLAAGAAVRRLQAPARSVLPGPGDPHRTGAPLSM